MIIVDWLCTFDFRDKKFFLLCNWIEREWRRLLYTFSNIDDAICTSCMWMWIEEKESKKFTINRRFMNLCRECHIIVDEGWKRITIFILRYDDTWQSMNGTYMMRCHTSHDCWLGCIEIWKDIEVMHNLIEFSFWNFLYYFSCYTTSRLLLLLSSYFIWIWKISWIQIKIMFFVVLLTCKKITQ